MKISKEFMNKILSLLKSEVVPAEGCTEPVAIAFAAAKAVEILGKLPDRLEVIASGNIIKNVKSVIVPNTGGMVGIEAAAAAGAICGDANKELLVISQMQTNCYESIKELMPRIQVFLSPENITLHIIVSAFCDDDIASVELRDYHTNVTKISKNGKVLFESPKNVELNEDFATQLSIETIYDAAMEVDLDSIVPLLEKVIKCNVDIAEEGLKNDYGVCLGKQIRFSIDSGLYGNDLRNLSACAAASGSDARMAGCALPVMTTAGSGNVGLTASLPIFVYCKEALVEPELMYRGLFFSHLTTVYIKSKIGRLSAYCGPMCASAGVAGALCLIKKQPLSTINKAIINALSGVSGIVCDGANSSCAVKIANAVYAAYDAFALALNDRCITAGDGLVGDNVESTIENVSRMALDGMDKTDKVILDIMTS